MQKVTFIYIIISYIVLSDKIFSCFIENDNKRIINSLKKLISIYAKNQRRKILYYFVKYRNIINKLFTYDFILQTNKIDTNSSIPITLSDIDPIDSYSIAKNIPNTSMHSNQIPYSNSSIAYSFISENKPKFENKSERFSKRTLNNTNIDKIGLQNRSLTNRIGNINLKQKNMKKRRTLSYGNLEIKMKRDDSFNFLDNNINNNIPYIYNNAFPPSIYTTPNKYLYPIILNNNDTFYNNSNINNSSLYNYQKSEILYPNEFNDKKPLLWYTNAVPSTGQVSILQDNRYLNNFQNMTPKYINNSAYFNSITNINNSYSEAYLNKQIFNFINANSKTKQHIINNIGKKHNIKLNKYNINNKLKNKAKQKKENSFTKNRNRQNIYGSIHRINYSEYQDFNDKRYHNHVMINNYKKNIKNSHISKLIKNIPKGQKKKNIINNLKSKNINIDNNKIIRNYSIEINSTSLKNNNDYTYENEKNDSQVNYTNKNEPLKKNLYSNPINYNDLSKNKINNDLNDSENRKEEEQNKIDESLRTSLQSINDSKILEIANKFIEDDKAFNKGEISEILKDKNYQKKLKSLNNY
jgi:hypothetical protein